MPDPKPPSEPDSLSLERLKQLPQWDSIERYIDTRLRGSGSRIRQLEAQLAEAGSFEAERAELEALRSEKQQREARIVEENAERRKRLVPASLELIPKGISPEAEAHIISQIEKLTVDKKVPVAGFGGARVGVPDAAALAADRAKFAGHRFLFGDRTKKWGRR